MIRIIFVGRSKEDWLRAQIDEYVKRIGRFTRIDIDEIKDEKILGKDYKRIKDAEGERILNLIKDDYVIALDSDGKSFDSAKFAKALKTAGEQHLRLTFIVGGALGLSDAVLKRANLKLSLSEMTFTNQMVRLLLVEQLYRAFTIMAGMEYHK
ncbi:23S rRNA (pseudouridine(1915)-N(3))-methyltransferase RlmH [Candidatus Woesearchaeota archaeon]|nr:23S rRNA (pseudouridine(1915)-N(3))-methyltransferase RlmH [Candidatus Woesearchaeota archaeon]